MKISLDFTNNEVKEYYKERLTKRNFENSEGSFGTVWVYGLSHIDYGRKTIELCQAGSMKFCNILLEDLDYFEVWEEK